MARSPLTESINKVTGMVTYVRENLSTEEYMLYLDMVAPQVEPEVVAKKTRTRRTRTPRTGLPAPASAKKEPESAKAEGGNGADLEPENFGPRCGVCGHGEQYQDHFQPSPNYHPFDAPAKSAAKRSSRKAAGANNTQKSEIEKVAAISASGD